MAKLIPLGADQLDHIILGDDRAFLDALRPNSPASQKTPERTTTMFRTELGRRLGWHGVLLFFLSLVEGLLVYSMRNPRMALTAHVGGITTALFFLAIAALWREIRLSERAAALAWWMTLVGGYGSVASLLLAALLGTSFATPIAGAGFSAPAWQETLVTAALAITGLPLFVASLLLLWGLRASAVHLKQ